MGRRVKEHVQPLSVMRSGLDNKFDVRELLCLLHQGCKRPILFNTQNIVFVSAQNKIVFDMFYYDDPLLFR